AFDDRGVVLVDGHLLRPAQVFDLHVFELDAEILGDGLAAGQHRDVFEHGLAAVAEPGRLDGRALQRVAQLVDHQRRQRLAFHVLSNDEERFPALGDALEQRKQVLHRAYLLLMDEDAHVFQHALHALRVGHEVGGEVAAVELHAFHDFQRRFHRLGFFDGDDAVLAHLLHCLGDDAANLLVIIGGNRADLRDHVPLHVLVQLLDLLHGHFHGLVDAALESRRARARRNRLHAFAEDGLREHRRRGGAVAGYVGSLGGDFPHHLRAHVLQGILQLDLLRHGHAVLGDDRRAELLFDHRVAPLRAQGDFYCVGKNVHAAKNRLARILTCNNLLRHFLFPPEIDYCNSFLLFFLATYLLSRHLCQISVHLTEHGTWHTEHGTRSFTSLPPSRRRSASPESLPRGGSDIPGPRS